MTSKERHERRYARRKQAREKKRLDRAVKCGDFQEVFSYENIYKAGKGCCRGVRWKSSTQKYEANIATNTEKLHHDLQAGQYKSRGFIEFGLYERGHYRWIRSVHISERVVQKVLCDKVLVPTFSPSFIYDNGACMKYKGIDFALDRFTTHLHRHYRKHGRAGAILQWDLSGFFDSIPHAPLSVEARKRIADQRIVALFEAFVGAFGTVGMGLGSQISQVCALLVASPIDHLAKDVLRVKGYGRYMDDGYLIHEDEGYLKECLAKLQELCQKLGLKLNDKKTRIVKLTRGFKFLKMRFLLTETGAVIRRIGRKSVTTMRRKLKSFARWVATGRMSMADVITSYTSWRGHAARTRAYKTIKTMDALFAQLFKEGLQCLLS